MNNEEGNVKKRKHKKNMDVLHKFRVSSSGNHSQRCTKQKV